MGVLSKINEVLANPGSLHPVLAIVKGIRNGAVYGSLFKTAISNGIQLTVLIFFFFSLVIVTELKFDFLMPWS